MYEAARNPGNRQDTARRASASTRGVMSPSATSLIPFVGDPTPNCTRSMQRPPRSSRHARHSGPHILDDFGWRDTGYMGSDFFETPHLDALAAAGMVFTDAYACAANCAPSRACLLSGQYTPRHRIFNVGTGPRGDARHRRLLHVPGISTLPAEIVTRMNKEVVASMAKPAVREPMQMQGFMPRTSTP